MTQQRERSTLLAGWTRRDFWRAALALSTLPAPAAGTLPSFLNPPEDAKMILYYWWFGPSQTESQVFRELRAMQEQGVGGTFIFPVYPLSASDEENYPYLSDKFLRVLRSTCEQSRKLSMSVDLLGGGGWPFGGPTIRLENSSRTIRMAARADGLLEGEEIVGRSPAGAVFISSPTRQRIKSCVIGGEGWVLDHLDPVQVRNYLDEVVAKLVDAAPPGSLRSINFDSLEAFQQNWTPQFPVEFQKRRGYDLIPRLTALWKDIGEDTEHIRYDYWRTLTDLFLDSFARPFHQWAKQRGVALQGKPMGMPVNDLRAFETVDFAVAEEYDWLEFSGPRWAASGAHVYGQNLIANEAYTWLRQPRYLTTLQDLKAGSDVQFLAGVNVIIGHGFSYSPDESGVPGWSYYASVYFHPKNPWWPYFRHLAKYVQRASFILRQGVQVADVALFLPEEDEMAASAAGQLNQGGQKVFVKRRLARKGDSLPQFGLKTAIANRSPLISTIVTNGYSLDGVNNDALQRATITNGRLRVGLGDYGVVILPGIKGMPVESLQKLQAFAKAGGKVIAVGRTPSMCYGLPDWKEKSERVRQIADALFGPGRPGRVVPDAEGSLLEALKQCHQPDIDFTSGDPDIGFVHRKTAVRDFYFIANTSLKPKRLEPVFRAGTGHPEIWDPLTGETRLAAEYRHEPHGTRVPLQLEGYGSTVVVFGRPASSPKQRRQPTLNRNSSRRSPIAGPWTLEIDGDRVNIDALDSWTRIEHFRHFSGTGKYRTTFQIDTGFLRSGQIWLSLGDVREIAEVEINGRACGVAWMTPYRLDVTSQLRPGRNELTVAVTNLLINRVIGQPKPDTSALTRKYAERFRQVSGSPDLKFQQNSERDVVRDPVPSGLLGPVFLYTSDTTSNGKTRSRG